MATDFLAGAGGARLDCGLQAVDPGRPGPGHPGRAPEPADARVHRHQLGLPRAKAASRTLVRGPQPMRVSMPRQGLHSLPDDVVAPLRLQQGAAAGAVGAASAPRGILRGRLHGRVGGKCSEGHRSSGRGDVRP